MGIDNTTHAVRRPGGVAALVASAMAIGTDATIEAMEADGQRQLVASELLPTDCNTAAFEAAGFTFGDPVPDDDLFRAATLPPGWTRHATDHPMWSHIRDEHGRHRAAVFYKAAFYDRRAFMRLLGPEEYVRTCVTDDVEPITDDTWATPAAVRESALVLAVSHDRRAGTSHGEEARELRVAARRAAALAVRVALEHGAAS